MHKELIQQLTHVLQTRFHFTHFRPGQLDALVSLMTQGRLMCIQPTGYGKSLLYQLPATLLKGMTLVISPLLALMRDQVEQLNQRFGIPAASLNTDQNSHENYLIQRNILSGNIRIIFIAPEQLSSIERLNFLKKLPIKLLVVDEAHCISTWGHDFRPSYRQIIQLTHTLVTLHPDIKLLALTATANKKTEEDIQEQLKVGDTTMIVQRESMNRPNIRLTVLPVAGQALKLATLTQLLNQLSGSGLIYCATRENTELVTEYVCSQGITAAAYHAGLEVKSKQHIQQGFIKDHYPIIAATNALGMGIDKPNLRFIIHFDFPGSITAYYQEVGRCGRDGLPADGILLYDAQDSRIQSYFIDSAQPSSEEFQHILTLFKQSNTPLSLAAIKRITGMHPTKLNVILAELSEQLFLQKIFFQQTQCYQSTKKSGVPILTRYAIQYKIRTSELLAIQRYAEQSKKCLMATLRINLGDSVIKSCKQCNRCKKNFFNIIQEKSLILAVSSWIDKRLIPIILNKKSTPQIAVGVALLDGKKRSPDFIHFMRERAKIDKDQLGLSQSLQQTIKTTLLDLTKHYQFGCVIPIPSRTWSARNALCMLIAHYLKISYLDILSWRFIPDTRQGELMNNDQRQHNVEKRLQMNVNIKLPKGSILLLDDYIGSTATMSEAARVLTTYTKNKIVPFTIAAIKWHIGKKGML